MKLRRIEALLLSLILSVSACMPMNTMSAFAAETAEEEVAQADESKETDAETIEEEVKTEQPEEELTESADEAAEQSEENTDDEEAETAIETAVEEVSDSNSAEAAADAEGTEATTYEAEGTEAESTEASTDAATTDAATTAATEATASTTEAAATEEATEIITESAAEIDFPTAQVGAGDGLVKPSADDLGGDSAEELLDEYIRQEFGLVSDEEMANYRKKNAGERLTGVTRKVYEAVASQLESIANGSRTSTVFEVDLSKKIWTAEELGVDKVLDWNESASKYVINSAAAKAFYDNDIVIKALLADYPYEMYWYNKVIGYVEVSFNYTAYTENGKHWFEITEVSRNTMRMPVLKDYAASEYEVNPSIGASVRNAVNNANNILTSYGAATDYDKLKGYCKEICDLVSYNTAALTDSSYSYTMDSGKTSQNGNPWQLVWVFDGDASTNVVCEGYAKAFQYLCDSTTFNNDAICCTSVTGYLGDEAHMWNVVTMEDGSNYLVDVTNCDEGTIGAPYELFLAGTSGSVAEGYYFRTGQYKGADYTYDSETTKLFSESEISFTDHYYGKKSITNISVTLSERSVYDGTVKKPGITVVSKSTGGQLVEGTDYTITYYEPDPKIPGSETQNIGPGADAGALLLTGIGDYYGYILVNFDIKKVQNFSVNPQTLTVDVGDWISYTTGAPTSETGYKEVQLKNLFGELYVNSNKKTVAQISANADTPGWVHAVAEGAAVITLTSEETKEYYADETTLNLTVKARDLSSSDCKATVAAQVGYTGKAVKPAVKVTYKGVELQEGIDYTLTYKNNVNFGKATVVIKGKSGRASGSRTLTFKIVPGQTSKLTVKNTDNGFKLNWARVPGANGYVIYRSCGGKIGKLAVVKDGDTLTYTDKTKKANKNGTLYTYIVKAKRGSTLSPFKKTVYRYRLTTPKISKIRSKSAGKITVLWNKNAKADGFEIQYSQKGGFKPSLTYTVKKGNCGGKTISVKKGKTYYVRIRSYKMNGNTKNVSAWSAVRKVKVR